METVMRWIILGLLLAGCAPSAPLTEEQRADMRLRLELLQAQLAATQDEMGCLAGGFARAAMPSPYPIPTGAALGIAANSCRQ
jgi:hypothetical protein